MKRVLLVLLSAIVLSGVCQGESVVKLTASDAAASDYFGFSSALSGDYAVVGAYGKDSYKGCAYIFHRDETNWLQQARLFDSIGAASDRFGRAVDIDGDYIVVGAYAKNSLKGSAFVYHRTGTNWTLQAELTPSGSDSYKFGVGVAIDGDTVAVGAPNAYHSVSNTGAVFIYRRSGATWNPEATLVLPPPWRCRDLGWNVDLNGDCLLATAFGAATGTNSFSGGAFIAERAGTNWTLSTHLTADNYTGSFLNPSYGENCALTSDRAAVGLAGMNDPESIQTGAVLVYEKPSGGWSTVSSMTETERLFASDRKANALFGASVAAEGDQLLAGAPGHSFQPYVSQEGQSYLFLRTNDTTWIEYKRLTAPDMDEGDYFGSSSGISSGIIINGAQGDADQGNWTGSAYINGSLVPGFPSDPYPPNNAGPYSPTYPPGQPLTWTNGGSTTHIDLYFGTSNPPTNKVLDNVTAVETYSPDLDYNQIYSWRVVCRNTFGESIGNVWQFRMQRVASFQLLPASLDFGDVRVGTNSAPQQFTVYNDGLGGLSGTITISNSVFWVRQNTGDETLPTEYDASIPFSLPEGATNTYDVIFAPDAIRDFGTNFRVEVTSPFKFHKLLPVTASGFIPDPGVPSAPSPVPGGSGVAFSPRLTWVNGTDTDRVSLYLGLVGERLDRVLNNVVAVEHYDAGPLLYNSNYIWEVHAHNDGGSTQGPEWNFSTKPVPELTMIAPNGRDIWSVQTSQLIEWESQNAAQNVRLELFDRDLSVPVATIEKSAPNGGSYLWAVPADTPEGNNYVVRVTDLDDPRYSDESDLPFIIFDGIYVLSPNGGERLTAGATYEIRWCGTEVDDAVRIDLYQEDQLHTTLHEGARNTGSYSWNVPCDMSGLDFKIRVTAVNVPAQSDDSDADFDIEILPPEAASNPSPGNGETGVLSNVTLQWSNGSGTCDVEVYLDTRSPPQELIYRGAAINSLAAGPLEPDSTVYWQVVCINDAGSAIGREWKFDVQSSPEALQLQPLLFNGNDIGLQWNDLFGDRTYHIFHCTNLGSGFFELDVTQTNQWFHTNGMNHSKGFYYLEASPAP